MFVTKVSVDAVYRDIQGSEPVNWVEPALMIRAAEYANDMLALFQTREFGRVLRTELNLEVIKIRFRARNTSGTDEGVMEFELIFSRWPDEIPDKKKAFAFEVELFHLVGGLKSLREVSQKELDANFAAALEKWWQEFRAKFSRAVEAEEQRMQILSGAAKARAKR